MTTAVEDIKNEEDVVSVTENEVDLFDFAYCSTKEGYANMLQYLSAAAENEPWSFDDTPNSILYKYIRGTFKQCYKQEKILYSNDQQYCCFNTGLLTPNGHDIVMLFEKNNRQDAQEWYLKGFKNITERTYMNIFSEIPKLAQYTEKYEELYFNPELPIVINTDHILDDNWERISTVVPLSKSIVKGLLIGVVEETKRKIKRNMRLVVPQFYKNTIMYLMPISIPISDNDFVTMALAVELTNTNQYRANTIFTKEMAYEKARLLMKPESNWLIG